MLNDGYDSGRLIGMPPSRVTPLRLIRVVLFEFRRAPVPPCRNGFGFSRGYRVVTAWSTASHVSRDWVVRSVRLEAARDWGDPPQHEGTVTSVGGDRRRSPTIFFYLFLFCFISPPRVSV